MIAAEATDLQLRLVEPFLNEVSPDEMARLAFSAGINFSSTLVS